MTECLCYK